MRSKVISESDIANQLEIDGRPWQAGAASASNRRRSCRGHYQSIRFLDRSRGWIIKQALTAWVDQEEERRRLTLEALADVDARRVIDHRAVHAWASSLDTGAPLPLPEQWI
jgi:predicted transcriptional regulator